MIKRFILWITLGFLHLDPMTGQISCYQCNVDSSSRFSYDCTDPYVPSPSDHLLPCPQDEPHHCLKAAILYNHYDVTVRACVPSRLVNTYCAVNNFVGSFPSAEVSCYYCKGNACNHSTAKTKPFGDLVLGLVTLVVVNFQGGIFVW